MNSTLYQRVLDGQLLYKKPMQERGQMYFFSDLDNYAHIYCILYLYYSSKVWGQMILMLLKEVSYA